jgi:hypothetical protein
MAKDNLKTPGVDISRGLERIERAEQGHRTGQVSTAELRKVRQSAMRGFNSPGQGQKTGKRR